MGSFFKIGELAQSEEKSTMKVVGYPYQRINKRTSLEETYVFRK